MQLDRNTKGRQKYALIKLRVDEPQPLPIDPAITSVRTEAVDFGNTPESEFFVIRLNDKYAAAALVTYASYAEMDGETVYAKEVMELALKARKLPNRKKPD